MQCPDCKDGYYYPLQGEKVLCDTCNGTRQVADSGKVVRPDPHADDEHHVDIQPRTTMHNPNYQTVPPQAAGRSLCTGRMFLCQRFEAIQHNLVAGVWYTHKTTAAPGLCSNVGIDPVISILWKSPDKWVSEDSPQGGPKVLYGPQGTLYSTKAAAYRRDPCIDMGHLFTFQFVGQFDTWEFFAGEDAYGKFGEELLKWSQVKLSTNFHTQISYHVPFVVSGIP